MSFRPILIGLVAAVALGSGGFAFYTGVTQGQSVPVVQPTPVSFAVAADQFRGFSALSNSPPVPMVEMRDEAGQPVTFEKFRGKVVLFNLWATWCAPCIREMPDLNSLQEDYANQDFIVVPVASGRQGKEEPAEFLRARGYDALTTYYDPDSLFLRTFDLDTLPTTFVLDRNGVMRGGVVGLAKWRSDRAKAVIDALLAEKS